MFSKKVIIAACVMVVPVFIGTVIYFAWQNKMTPAPSALSFSDPSFTISYPDNWIGNRMDIAGGGTSFTARANSDTEYFPRFTMESTPLSGQSVEGKIKVLSFYNLQRTEATFKGYPATKLAGLLHMHFDTGNPQQKPVYKVFLFVPTKTMLYTISYAYFDDNTRAESEAQMQKMLDSLILH